MFSHEIVKAEYQSASEMTDKGFDHLVGMLNAVTVYSCARNRPATIEIQRMEIVRFMPEGDFITEATYNFEDKNSLVLKGEYWLRKPKWFEKQPDQKTVTFQRAGEIFLLDLAKAPENIAHVWTEPRVKVVPGARYGILAVVRVTGDARLQFGMDYWRGEASPYNGWSEGCATSNNCEAWLSDWIGDTKGEFKQVLVPRAFSRSQ